MGAGGTLSEPYLLYLLGLAFNRSLPRRSPASRQNSLPLSTDPSAGVWPYIFGDPQHVFRANFPVLD